MDNSISESRPSGSILDMHPIPPLLPPDRTPPLRTDSDLHRQWAAMMGPLGFGSRNLWLLFLDGHDRPTDVVPIIEDVPVTLTPRMARNLAEMCAEVLTDLDTGGSVAPLLTRPGRVDPVPSDRAWARGLASAAAAADVHMRPLFVATDAAIHAVDTSLAA